MEKYPETQTKEFLKHYSETWLRMRSVGLKQPEWVLGYLHAGAWHDENHAVVVVSVGAMNAKHEMQMENVDFDTTPVKFGLYPHRHNGSMPLVVGRYPNRQWKWGLCRGNTFAHQVYDKSLFLNAHRHSQNLYGIMWNSREFRHGGLQVDSHVAKDILFPTYTPDYLAAVTAVRKLKSSFVVIDSESMVTCSPIHEGLLLWRWDRPIAKLHFLSEESTEAEVLSPIFKQELLDFYNRKGITNVRVKD